MSDSYFSERVGEDGVLVLFPGFGHRYHIDIVIKEAVAEAKKQGQNLDLNFNEVVVTISPGSNVDEVTRNFNRIASLRN